MQTSEMRFDNDGHQLVGTLVSPTLDGGPVALLVSGSGPIDRESNAKRLSISVMRDVAERLALRGVGSFRYDKRGVGESGGDYRSAGLYDNVADASAAVAALRARSDVGPIVIVGHSEGALIAAEVAANDPDLAGIVLLSGAAVDGKAVLRRQGELVAATLPRPVKWLMRMLRQDLVRTQSKRLAQLETSTRDVERIQLVRVNAKWFREFLAHDPSAVAGTDRSARSGAHRQQGHPGGSVGHRDNEESCQGRIRGCDRAGSLTSPAGRRGRAFGAHVQEAGASPSRRGSSRQSRRLGLRASFREERVHT